MGQRLRQECDPEVFPRGFQQRFKRRTFLPWARVVDCPSGRSRRFLGDYDQFFEAALNEGTVRILMILTEPDILAGKGAVENGGIIAVDLTPPDFSDL